MFMENVDGDHYFLSLIALKQFSSVTVQFLSVDRSGYFNSIKSLLRTQEILFCQCQWL